MDFETLVPGIEGLALFKLKSWEDDRGWFQEAWRRSDLGEAGLPESFKQANQSLSRKGTLRGLHLQKGPSAQGKLVQVLAGRVWDVVVDLRPGSSTWGQWVSQELSGDNRLCLWIPPGFAHGFLAMEDNSLMSYLCTEEYNPDSEAGIRWDDPDLRITWPDTPVFISQKDQNLPLLKEYRHE